MNSFSTPLEYDSNLFMDFVSTFYMKMFFLFSGFVYVYRKQKVVTFISNSFKSLIYPCIIFWILNILVIMFIRKLNGVTPFFKIPSHEIINFYWFCKCLFVSRIVLFLCCMLDNHIKSKYSDILFVSILIIGIMYALPSNLKIPWGFRTIHIYYVFGYYLNQKKILEKSNKTIFIPFAIALILGLISIRYTVDISPIVRKITSVIMPIPIILLIYYFFKKWLNIKVWLLTDLGRCSLMVYLVHLCVLSILCQIIDFAITRSLLFNYSCITVIFVILLMISLFISKIVINSRIAQRVFFLKYSK